MTNERNDVSLPVEFFSRSLGSIEDLAELKVILHVAHLASSENCPTVPWSALLKSEVVRSVAGPDSPEPAESRLRRAVDRAVAGGSLLRVIADGVPLLLVSSPETRSIVNGLRADAPDARKALGLSDTVSVTLYRPNIYGLYERAIGPLTPLIAEQLRDAERSYPRAWIEQAIFVAVNYNKRNWRYVQTVLSAWEETGAPDGAIEQHS